MSAVIVHCSCPDAERARTIARTLVEERLAACVQVVPGIHSVYRWEEAIREDNEALLLVKTTQARVQPLMARIAELHPYQVPEILALDADAAARPYLEWLAAETVPR